MKCRNQIFKLLLICLISLSANIAVSQQSRVDSVVQLFKNSKANKQFDTVMFNTGMDLLSRTSLKNENQIEQLKASAKRINLWGNYSPSLGIEYYIFRQIMKQDMDEAIRYGKSQIEEAEKLNTFIALRKRDVILRELRLPIRNSNRLEEGLIYYSQKLNQYKLQNDSSAIATSHYVLAGFNDISGLTDLAIYNMKKSLSYIDKEKNKYQWSNNMGVLGSYYLSKNDKSEGLKFSKIALEERLKDEGGFFLSALYLTSMKIQTNQLDSAAYYLAIAEKDPALASPEPRAAYLQVQAKYNIKSDKLETAENHIIESWDLIKANNIPVSPGTGTIAPDYYLALIRIKQNKTDEAIKLLISDIERLNNNRKEILRDYKLMAELYQKTGQGDLAAETYTQFIALQDSLLTDQDKFRSISFEAEQEMNENQLSIERLESQNQLSKTTRNFSIGIVALLLILSVSIYYRFQSKKKANEALNKTLANLKSTQAQLIQSEKMASLGELTAGIAHEIQNPLNFVNNFSEVSKELLDEMREELTNGDTEEVNAIMDDVIQNLEKINHHGKRADGIVKGMLQHSRSSSSEKEPTDINALADEYFRLAYHGLRAKDKAFNSELVTDFDDRIKTIDVIPQDIGRVILNLLTNAFYATQEKQNSNLDNYKPKVSISTRLKNNEIEIEVTDNGNGIPDKVKDKIFQPFFTTKPTGSGTGLGLSLSYDIVMSHGGEMRVESEEGVGTTFSITLPIKMNHIS